MIGILESKRIISTPEVNFPIIGAPIAYYRLNELEGDTIIDAMSNYNGVNFGGIIDSNGINKSCYSYTTELSHSKLMPSSALIPTITSSFSINIWIYPTIIPSGDYSIRAVNVFKSISFSSIIILGCDNTNKAYAYVGGTRYELGVININRWSMLSITYDGSSCYLYLNGVLISTNTQTLNGVGNSTPVQLSKSDSGVYYGKIDEPCFYDYNISGTDINDLFNLYIP